MPRIAVAHAAAAFCAALAMTVTSASAATSARKPACQLTNPDDRIYEITLGKGDDLVAMVGDKYALVQESPASSFPWAVFFSRDRRQTLALRKYPGSGEHDVYVAEVQYAGRKAKANLSEEPSGYMGKEPKGQRLPTTEFVTANGIKLGMTKKAVLAKLGDCFAVRKRADSETLRHDLADANSEFLKKAKMPSYYAEYQFDGGRLVRFRFGYPYP
jgi:hypothetical protein